MVATVALSRYVEPADEGLRLGMPRGSWAAKTIDHEWRAAHDVEGRRVFVEVCCPDCGAHLTLSRENHTVAADGTITPSLVCPHSPCTWHVMARLDGWPP